MGPSRRVAPAPAVDATEEQKPRPRRPTRIAPSSHRHPTPPSNRRPHARRAGSRKQHPDGCRTRAGRRPAPPKPRWLQDTPDAPRHTTEDDDDATLDRPASPPDWLARPAQGQRRGGRRRPLRDAEPRADRILTTTCASCRRRRHQRKSTRRSDRSASCGRWPRSSAST